MASGSIPELSHEDILSEFLSATQLEDSRQGESILIATDWDLKAALQTVSLSRQASQILEKRKSLDILIVIVCQCCLFACVYVFMYLCM